MTLAIAACSSGNWAYVHGKSRDFGHDSVVSDATRRHERNTFTAHSWIARHADGQNPWRAAVEAEGE